MVSPGTKYETLYNYSGHINTCVERRAVGDVQGVVHSGVLILGEISIQENK